MPSFVSILPVLFLEFLSISLTRSILPPLLTTTFPTSIYLIMGLAEAIKGILSFTFGPSIGSWSDTAGRKKVLIYTVFFTTAPIIVLGLISVLANPTDTMSDLELTSTALKIFITLFSLSGIFASTFTLTFSYIADTTSTRKETVIGFGLALSTFGLSFTIGPMLGGYIARPEAFIKRYSTDIIEEGSESGLETDSNLQDSTFTTISDPGVRRVFICSLILIALDLIYVSSYLRETITRKHSTPLNSPPTSSSKQSFKTRMHNAWSTARTQKVPHPRELFHGVMHLREDPLLNEIANITFLYYTSVWSIVSTLVFYVTKRFEFGPQRLGELLSAFGLCTVFAEGVLVGIVVPVWGEIVVMRFGLICFILQCLLISLASRPWHIFACVLLSTATNLVYPSLTSLVTSNVSESRVGESLGAINGIKSLTEGIGPLVFGMLMSFTEDSFWPGSPYVLSALLACFAWHRTSKLSVNESYVSEKYVVEMTPNSRGINDKKATGAWLGFSPAKAKTTTAVDIMRSGGVEEDNWEGEGLLSEVEEDEDGRFSPAKNLFSEEEA
ncbi:hypothetical protein TrST_g12306 [Triparma strigata]|uniref:Major facilitator superfamily (MFS) profile domain-containing protein n=1 Tax=Triparma strigata TaxID=1606541 RepID=A0A9W7AY41_9STRA|nr:hypothetical protein TrST_g12306 [Triparma strigata]